MGFKKERGTAKASRAEVKVATMACTTLNNLQAPAVPQAQALPATLLGNTRITSRPL